MSTKLSPLTEEEAFLPEDHWAEKYLSLTIDGYNTGS